MKKLFFHNLPPRPAACSAVLLIAWFALVGVCVCAAQDAPPASPPVIPSPADIAPSTGPPPPGWINISADGGVILDEKTGYVLAKEKVIVHYADVTITADRAEGNLRREVVLSGNARVERNGAVSYADAIHFFPQERTYRLDNPRSVLPPSFLQNRLLEPVILRGGTLFGTRDGYALAENSLATTCPLPDHRHYELRFRSAELFPGKRLVLRRVGVVFFGQKLFVLPHLVIPLDQRQHRFRTDYLPEFGRNINEGYYARFPYAFAVGAAAGTFLRLSATQKLGMGYRVEQSYQAGKQENYFNTSGFSNVNSGFGAGGTFVTAYGPWRTNPRLARMGTGLGPENGGLFAAQGYFGEGIGRNFNTSFRHQQGIGSNNRISLLSELQRNSFQTFTNQTSQNTRLNFVHADGGHGSNVDAALGLATNDSGGFRTNQLTGSLRQSWDFDVRGANRNSLSYNFDFSRYASWSGSAFSRTAQLNSRFEFQHSAVEYSYSLEYNKSSLIGEQKGGGNFGTLERLPELQASLDTLHFKGGWLRRLPLRFDIGVGRYSEPSSDTMTERALLGFILQDSPLLRTRSTEMTFGGGFEQRLYGDGAAQFIWRNTTRLRQRLGGRSGFDLNYQYQEPAGGTPFLFDTYGRTHNLTAEAGYLDDPRFQLTARAGYDFLGTSSLRPWQSLSTRLMWRPTPTTRFDATAIYDPNTSRFFSASGVLRFRGRRNLALDLYTRYDPQQGKFSQLNSQFNIPVGRSWRLAGLVRYNGLRGQLESANLQVAHTWDCMEASVTYSETPLGFRNDRQLFLTLRLTALPFFRSFARGPGGDALGPGIGDIY